MCRWLAYAGPPIFLDSLLYEPGHSLIDQSLRARQSRSETNADGAGVGWYGERPEPGLYRQIQPAWNDSNLANLSRHVRSGLFFAHVRASTGTPVTMSNCHPFANGRWMFMHNGQIGGYERVRRAIDEALPDPVYGARHGTTDSEAFFLLCFAHGLADDPAGALAQTLEQVCAIQAAAGLDPNICMTAALADGDRLWAIRIGIGDAAPSLYWSRDGERLVIVSEPFEADSATWHEIAPGHLLRADRDGACEIAAFADGQPRQRIDAAALPGSQ